MPSVLKRSEKGLDIDDAKHSLLTNIQNRRDVSSSRRDHPESFNGSITEASSFNACKESIRSCIKAALKQQLSSSMLVMGSTHLGLTLTKEVIESIPEFQINDSNKDKNYVAHINSSLVDSDQEAIVELSSQFIVRGSGDKEVNAALEDLENHFQQCRLDGRPAVIIIEGFEMFAVKKRQTVIYTLLDLMHNKKLYFIVSLCKRIQANNNYSS